MLSDVLGAVLGTLRVIGALVLLFFLPGWLLINALYPRKGELDREYDALYRLTLGIVLSIAVTVFWSFLLNSFGVDKATMRGYVDSANIAGASLGAASRPCGQGSSSRASADCHAAGSSSSESPSVASPRAAKRSCSRCIAFLVRPFVSLYFSGLRETAVQ